MYVLETSDTSLLLYYMAEVYFWGPELLSHCVRLWNEGKRVSMIVSMHPGLTDDPRISSFDCWFLPLLFSFFHLFERH